MVTLVCSCCDTGVRVMLAFTCISVVSESSARMSSVMFMYTGRAGTSGGISNVVPGSIVKSPPPTTTDMHSMTL